MQHGKNAVWMWVTGPPVAKDGFGIGYGRYEMVQLSRGRPRSGRMLYLTGRHR